MSIENLLREINLLLVQERERQKARTERGENFNVFSVIGLSTEEVRLHSAFLAELLNPLGTHGLKDAFLKAFLQEVINDENFSFDTTSAKVKPEYVIDFIDDSAERGGRIDILIRNDNKGAIVIENKINAGEQINQLLRYHNFVNDNGYEYKLLFLNKDGSNPTNVSTGNQVLNFAVISYREHILKWLNRCVELSACYPQVRESIRQYILTIKNICNIMDNQNELLDILTSRNNIETTLSILENSHEIHNRVRENFGEQLKELAAEYGFEMDSDDGVFRCESDKWIRFFNKNNYNLWYITIGVDKHTEEDGYRFGIRIPYKNLQYVGKQYWESEPDAEWPFGWGYLRGGNNNEGRFWRWDDLSTLRAMANGELTEYIEKELFEKIVENHLIEELEQVMPDNTKLDGGVNHSY
ncbi:MAG TPA: PD-(D/E)XK nuclease family protein [Petrimonas sp.]|uniref:PDDEXK-like family protein n=1 Tax=Petrimonas sp. TaxID=2023866 RepID=UPI00176BA5AD|nr:PD-(D/E)XK nuclease family protein [Petrimonas sp.]